MDEWAYEKLNVNDGAELWNSLGCPKHKLIVGMAFYGRTYTLGSPENHGLKAYVKKWDTNGGKAGPFTNESGFLSYFEFCQEEDSWQKEFDSIGKCPFAHKGNQWVGYEDSSSLAIKMDWLKERGYGGAMIWALDLDDYRGVCGAKDVLFNTLVKGLEGYSVRVPPAHELTTTRKPNPWWPPAPSSSTSGSGSQTATSKAVSGARSSTRYTEPTTARSSTTTTTSTTSPIYTNPASRKPQSQEVSSEATSLISNQRPDSDAEKQTTSKQEDYTKTGVCTSQSSGQLLSSLRANPNDPNQYFWCVYGRVVTLNCPPNSRFVEKERQCSNQPS